MPPDNECLNNRLPFRRLSQKHQYRPEESEPFSKSTDQPEPSGPLPSFRPLHCPESRVFLSNPEAAPHGPADRGYTERLPDGNAGRADLDLATLDLIILELTVLNLDHRFEPSATPAAIFRKKSTDAGRAAVHPETGRRPARHAPGVITTLAGLAITASLAGVALPERTKAAVRVVTTSLVGATSAPHSVSAVIYVGNAGDTLDGDLSGRLMPETAGLQIDSGRIDAGRIDSGQPAGIAATDTRWRFSGLSALTDRIRSWYVADAGDSDPGTGTDAGEDTADQDMAAEPDIVSASPEATMPAADLPRAEMRSDRQPGTATVPSAQDIAKDSGGSDPVPPRTGDAAASNPAPPGAPAPPVSPVLAEAQPPVPSEAQPPTPQEARPPTPQEAQPPTPQEAQPPTPPETQSPMPSSARDRTPGEVGVLTALARQQMGNGHLSAPQGDNAMETYRRILAIVPNASDAAPLRDDIRSGLREQAREATKRGNWSEALRYYELAIDPADPPEAGGSANSAISLPPPARVEAAHVDPLREDPAPAPQVAAREAPDRSGAATAPMSSELVMAFQKRGDEMLSIGDIAGARLFYERAGASGYAPAATSAGKTHDPMFLKETGARGIQPDPEKAAEWYRKAIKLGDVEAEARLKRLTALIAK
jgi:hypothetical protein